MQNELGDPDKTDKLTEQAQSKLEDPEVAA
jgi:hypothetical protein